MLAYGLFAPLLVVGPIASYDEVARTVDHPVPLDRDRAVDGVTQVLVGLFKVFVVAYLLDWSGDVFSIYAANEAWRIVIALAAFTGFFYVNFAGYSDMAIGTGTLLGGTMRPNFDRPFLQTDPTVVLEQLAHEPHPLPARQRVHADRRRPPAAPGVRHRGHDDADRAVARRVVGDDRVRRLPRRSR